MPLGTLPAMLVSGVIWGVWHTPVILMGHNYPDSPILGVPTMIMFCIVFGIILGWLRLKSDSVWPAVIAHGAINGSAGVIYLFHRVGSEVDSIYVGVTGWSGWILPLIGIVVLYIMGELSSGKVHKDIESGDLNHSLSIK